MLFPTIAPAQKLPGKFTCRDLVDVADGKLSRSMDEGKTYVPINVPRPRDAFSQTLLAHDTYQCQRLLRGEITAAEFDALRAEKIHQLNGERRKAFMEQKQLEIQQQALQNQQRALQVQRQSAAIQALQAEAARRQQERHHQDWMRQQQIQQQQLEQIRQEQAQPRSFSCYRSGNAIHCN